MTNKMIRETDSSPHVVQFTNEPHTAAFK